jgi:hypothetical protein
MAYWSVLRIAVPVFFVALIAAYALHGVYR